MNESTYRRSFIWTGFLPTAFVVNFATLGPLGARLKAPGTWGSVAGILWYTAAFAQTPPLGYLVLLVLSLFLAVGICGEAEERLMKRDPGEVVLDEVVAVPLCFLGLGGALLDLGAFAWVLLVAGFGLFRLFDILKPFGISRLQNLHAGLGVVADDVAAALVTCLCLHAGYAAWLHFIG